MLKITTQTKIPSHSTAAWKARRRLKNVIFSEFLNSSDHPVTLPFSLIRSWSSCWSDDCVVPFPSFGLHITNRTRPRDHLPGIAEEAVARPLLWAATRTTDREVTRLGFTAVAPSIPFGRCHIRLLLTLTCERGDSGRKIVCVRSTVDNGLVRVGGW